MKSGPLTSLSGHAFRSDVRVVHLRCKHDPPPRIEPLLINPHPVLRAPLRGRPGIGDKYVDVTGCSGNPKTKFFAEK